MEFSQCLQNLKEYLEDSENAVEGTIPNDLLLIIRQSGIDPKFR